MDIFLHSFLEGSTRGKTKNCINISVWLWQDTIVLGGTTVSPSNTSPKDWGGIKDKSIFWGRPHIRVCETPVQAADPSLSRLLSQCYLNSGDFEKSKVISISKFIMIIKSVILNCILQGCYSASPLRGGNWWKLSHHSRVAFPTTGIPTIKSSIKETFTQISFSGIWACSKVLL